MSLALAYMARPASRSYYDNLIISHFDGHGIATSGALTRILKSQGKSVKVISKFPDTGPTGFTPEFAEKLLSQYSASTVHVVDIPVNVRNPEASLAALQRLAREARVIVWDHHETDRAYVPRMIEAGAVPVIADTATSMAAAMGLFSEEEAKKLAIVGIVADRDASVLRVAPREEVERRYLPLANRLDVIVRQPRILGASDQGEVAERLAEEGVALLERVNVEYPPETLARELESKIVEEGVVALLVDWSDQDITTSQWTPKTLEQLLLRRSKHIAVAVVPGYNPRTRSIEGWDVRVLKYWLAPSDIPSPEEVARDLIEKAAIKGNVVGHGDYISVRFATPEEAREAARLVYRRYEGELPTTAHLVNDRMVAQAIVRDFKAILEKLVEIHEDMRRMYEEYLRLKEEQVRLLRETRRHEYD